MLRPKPRNNLPTGCRWETDDPEDRREAARPRFRDRRPAEWGRAMTTKENPAPRANAGNRANKITLAEEVSTMKQAAPPDFAARFIARRFRLPRSVAALVARLAKLAEVLS